MKFDIIHVMDEMTANVKAAVIRATQAEADKQRLFDRVSQLEEIVHEARAALDQVMIAPPRGAKANYDPDTDPFSKEELGQVQRLNPNIDPDLGW